MQLNHRPRWYAKSILSISVEKSA